MNINGSYDEFLAFLQTTGEKGLLKQANRGMLLVSDDIEELPDKMEHYKAPTAGKWIKKSRV